MAIRARCYVFVIFINNLFSYPNKFFILPNFLLAQNLYTQLVTPVSLHQNQIKSHCNNNSYVKLIESINPLKHRSDSLRSSCDSTAKSLYFIRFAGIDKEDCINFYGFSLGWFHQNPNANFSGLSRIAIRRSCQRVGSSATRICPYNPPERPQRH